MDTTGLDFRFEWRASWDWLDEGKKDETIMLVIPLNDEARKHLETSAPGKLWKDGGLVVDPDAYLPLVMSMRREGWRLN